MASELWMTGHRVELPEMLAGRENRARKQRALHQKYPGTLVCFTLNIAGPIKVFALSREIFALTYEKIIGALAEAGYPITYRELDPKPYGWEAYLAVDRDALEVKKVLLELEEKDPAGRLFDIDVLRPDGSKVSREDFGLPARSCLVCGQPTIACARSRAHTVAQLQDKTTDVFLEALRQVPFTPARIGGLCTQAMLLEVYTTPKPGLVDRNNTGSHSDMTVETFERSTAALESYFAQCAEAGMLHHNWSPRELLQVIRPLGLVAEQQMYLATQGINTHKGMIFSMGILACAAGYVMEKRSRGEGEQLSGAADLANVSSREGLVSQILNAAGQIAGPAWDGDLQGLECRESLTAGEEQYLNYGVGGIRREAALGYPSVRHLSWPVFMAGMESHGQWERAGAAALMKLVAHVTDTNVIHRSSLERQREIHRELQELWQQGEPDTESICRWDEKFIQWNVSPGGCADLLALTYFLYECTEFLSFE